MSKIQDNKKTDSKPKTEASNVTDNPDGVGVTQINRVLNDDEDNRMAKIATARPTSKATVIRNKRKKEAGKQDPSNKESAPDATPTTNKKASTIIKNAKTISAAPKNIGAALESGSAFNAVAMIMVSSRKIREFNHEYMRSVADIFQKQCDHFNILAGACEEAYELIIDHGNIANDSLNALTKEAFKSHEQFIHNVQKAKKGPITVQTVKNQYSETVGIIDDITSTTMSTFIDLSTILQQKINEYALKNQKRWFKLTHFEE